MKQNQYNPAEVEKKWQKYWEKNKTYEAKEDKDKEKFYGLIEFPYPSGAGLHVGHPRPFTAMDVICRKKRMEGKNVLFPIGFDAFGLPTENYAIKTGRPPAEVTAENIANFTRQLKMLGYSFDWSRAVDTTDPKYYKWTQWIFLQMFKHGLAYKKAMPINWCLSCKIGLANEEVVDGKCERCGGPVEKRNKEQWMLGITKYADKLLEGLKDVDYITAARTQQENWIGRSDGALVQFTVIASDEAKQSSSLEIFTTRPDTLFGATYLVLSPENKVILNLKSSILNFSEVENYIINSKKKSDQDRTDNTKEKTGVELKGLKAINPANNEELPIFVADYVLDGYGTGAIMAVPAHDERDFEFAKKYGLPIKRVVEPKFVAKEGESAVVPEVGDFVKRNAVAAVIRNPKTNKYLAISWKNFLMHGLVTGGVEEGEDMVEAAMREIHEETGYKNIKLVSDSSHAIHSLFYHRVKKQNRWARFQYLFFDLIDEEKDQMTEEDGAQHEVVWLDKEEMKDFFSVVEGKYIVELINNSKEQVFTDEGIAFNSEFLNWLDTKDAKEKMINWLEEKGLGKRQVQYKLRDWVFSRQRYWGEPIPLVHCESCAGWIPVPEKDLPLKLPEVKKYEPTDTGESPLSTITDWVNTKCPVCGGPAKRETDTMPNWAGSSWYFLRYCDPNNDKSLFNTGFVRKPAIVATEKDKQYFDVFKKVYSDLEKTGIKTWAGNRLMLNGINQDLWLPFRTVCVLLWNTDLAQAVSYLKEQGYSLIQDKSGNVMFEKDGVNVEFIPVYKDKSGVYSLSYNNVKQLMKETDLPKQAIANLWGFNYRIVSPEYNLEHLKYVQKHEPEHRAGTVDDERIEFLENWIKFTNQKLSYWNPVDWYNGGMEHTVLHLLYSRFWNQFLFDIGVVPTREPYKKRTSHGMILASDGEKMSKSRGNVVNPDDMVRDFGADAFRTYIMFMGPFDQAVAWDTNGVVGVRRFLDRVWNIKEKVKSKSEKEKTNLDALLHQTIKKVTEDIEAMRFNTAISSLMILVNEMSKSEVLSLKSYSLLLQLLSPFAPHLAEELWSELGNKTSITQSVWPKYDPELAKEDKMTIAVQVNGKLRDTLEVGAETSEEEIKKLVLESEKVQKWLEGKEPKKVIYVKGKLVSIVA